jgi:hypothetical protein
MAGPDYVKALQNALEKKGNECRAPPRTGGTQISTRLDEFVLNHVDAILRSPGGTGRKYYTLLSNVVYSISTLSWSQKSLRRLFTKSSRSWHHPNPPAIPER